MRMIDLGKNLGSVGYILKSQHNLNKDAFQPSKSKQYKRQRDDKFLAEGNVSRIRDSR